MIDSCLWRLLTKQKIPSSILREGLGAKFISSKANYENLFGYGEHGEQDDEQDNDDDESLSLKC